MSARCYSQVGSQDALDVAERVRKQAVDLPGAAQSLGAAVAGRAALGSGLVRTASVLLERAVAALSASGYAIGWGIAMTSHARLRSQCAVPLERPPPRLPHIDKLERPFRSLDFERSVARAWVAAGQGAVSEAITILLSTAERVSAKGQFAAEVVCLQTATQFGDRSCVSRLRELESVVEGPVSGWPRGSPRRCSTATPVKWPWCRRNSNAWVTSLPPSMRLPRPPSRIAAKAYEDRRWGPRHGQQPWPNNAAEQVLRRFVRPASRCR